jgi:probable F420-dependent oxidoreductase
MTKALDGVGVWDMLFRFGDPGESAEAVAEIDELGFTAVWMPDAGPGLFEALERALAASTSITVASGILNVWMHDAEKSAAACHEFQAAHGQRLLVGLGVSHAPAVNQMLADNTYRRPLAKMTEYLDALDAADPPLRSATGCWRPWVQMLRLARDRAAGAHPYLVTPNTPPTPGRNWARTGYWHRSKGWCWRPIPASRARWPARTWRCTSGSPTT